MNKIGLALLSLTLMSGTVLAADEPDSLAPITYNGGLYLSTFGGINLLNQIEYDSTAVSGTGGVLNTDYGYSIDAAIGHQIDGGLSLEGQVGYLYAGLTDGTFVLNNSTVVPFTSGGSTSALYAMANAWYGVDLGGITPFIGGGVGIAYLTIDGQFDAPLNTSAFNDSGTTYAVQIGGGASFNVSDSVDLVARYRYFMTGDVDFTDGLGSTVTGGLSTSIVDVGLKVSF